MSTVRNANQQIVSRMEEIKALFDETVTKVTEAEEKMGRIESEIRKLTERVRALGSTD